MPVRLLFFNPWAVQPEPTADALAELVLTVQLEGKSPVAPERVALRSD